MVDWKFIIGLAIGIILVLIIGSFIGWGIAKLKFKRKVKKIDQEIHKPENVDKYIDLYKDAKQSEIEREERNNGRYRKLLSRKSGSSGDESRRELGDIKELIRRKQETKRADEHILADRRDEESRKLQDTKVDNATETDWSY